MVKHGVLAVDRDIVDADIALGAGPHGSDAAMLVFLARQRDHRVGLERLDQLGQLVRVVTSYVDEQDTTESIASTAT